MRLLMIVAALVAVRSPLAAQQPPHDAPGSPGPVAPAPADAAAPSVQVVVHRFRREVEVRVGPFAVPAMAADMAAMMQQGDMRHDEDVLVHRFDWPVDGYARGFHLEVLDRDGRPLPRRVLHHLIAVNYDRRDLLYPAVQRIFGAGTETGDVVLPETVGIPFAAGERLGFYCYWMNDTGHDLTGVTVRVVFPYTPRGERPSPMAVFPLYADVNYHTAGDDTFDVPPGHSRRVWDFAAPVGGRILGIGGHLHDYGAAITLEDAATGDTLAHLTAERTAEGRVTGVSRQIYWLRAARLQAGRHYRLVADYESPRADTLHDGAMANVGALFAPDDPACWPAVDASDPEFRKDLASVPMVLPSGGTALVTYPAPRTLATAAAAPRCRMP